MKKLCLFYCLAFFANILIGQCPTPTGLFVTNITHNTALANWSPVNGVDHYIIRKRELGSLSWSNLANIDSTMSSRNLPLLQPLTTYEWQIRAFCDSTNQLNSSWSNIDTFSTIAFVPAIFNPLLFYGMSSTLCNTHISFNLRLIQQQNEPDIGTSTITSDGGSFDLTNINSGDTVGSAELKTATDTFLTTLIVSVSLGNLAIINSVDTSGILGFFTIKNLNPGVEITSTSPNDGNNHTTGYTSELIFENLFVTPSSPGVLRFTADIQSELNDQFFGIDSSNVIYCNTNIENTTQLTKRTILKTISLLGKSTPFKRHKVIIYIYNDGSFEKKLLLD